MSQDIDQLTQELQQATTSSPQNRNGDKPVRISEIYWKDYLESKNYDKDINNMCNKCIQEQIDKFGKRVIECNGLASAKEQIPEDLLSVFSEEDLKIADQLVNPYAWAKANLSEKFFTERWYQEHYTSCTSKRLVLRCGRRAGKTYALALKITHRAITTRSKILIATPYDVQAEELMMNIEDILHNLSPEYGTYNQFVKRYVKSPSYLMSFKNGSRIRAFTTGSSGAGSIRGQAADVIVLDEVDYMDEASLNSILAILADNENVELWAASTPQGKGRLWKLEQSPSFKSFHFPSFVLPHYNDKLDQDFRDQLTEIGYVQEVMAEYGETETGVFQEFFIQRNTFRDIDRDIILKDRNRFIIILGVDWNDDKNGTRFYAVAFDRKARQFFTAHKDRIAREGWTQVDAVKKLIDLNRKFKFDHIYLDEGYGVSNIQFIKKYAQDRFGKLPVNHPDLKLADVVGINFSSKIEVHSPFGGEPIRKDMKVYIVENAIRMIERDLVKFDEEYDQDLLLQMRSYEILRRSPTGRPVYGVKDKSIGDHDLDAFMLALLGWSMQYSEFLNQGVPDLLIKTVSREEMMGDIAPLEDPMLLHEQGIGSALLFAKTENSRSRPEKLFNRRINRYNRASFAPKNKKGLKVLGESRTFGNQKTILSRSSWKRS